MALGDAGCSTLDGRRLVRARGDADRSLRDWPQARRELLMIWLKKSAAESTRWVDCVRWSGNAQHEVAHELLSGLLVRGWVEVEEVTARNMRGSWQPQILRWLDKVALRVELGLPDPNAERDARAAARHVVADDERLFLLAHALRDSPPQTAIKRRELFDALVRWLDAGRGGTRRDFSHEARGATKAISETEWRWLAEAVDLAACGIGDHPPLLYLAGAGRVWRGSALAFDLAQLDEHMALTATALAGMSHMDGFGRIAVVENLTSFARAASNLRDGVTLLIWLPGYAAGWWLRGFDYLLPLAQVPVVVACDCDPWGVDLAQRVAARVEAAGLPWQPWGMDGDTLRGCRHRLPLNDADQRKLQALRRHGIAAPLLELVDAMARLDEAGLPAKAEQEQYI